MIDWEAKHTNLLHILQSAVMLFDEDIIDHLERRKWDRIVKTFRDQIDEEVQSVKAIKEVHDGTE